MIHGKQPVNVRNHNCSSGARMKGVTKNLAVSSWATPKNSVSYFLWGENLATFSYSEFSLSSFK